MALHNNYNAFVVSVNETHNCNCFLCCAHRGAHTTKQDIHHVNKDQQTHCNRCNLVVGEVNSHCHSV